MVTTMMVMAAVSVVVTLLFILLQLPFLQVLLLNSAVSMPAAVAVELALAGNKGERLLNHMASPSALLSALGLPFLPLCLRLLVMPVTMQFYFLGIFHHPDLPKERKDEWFTQEEKKKTKTNG